MTFTKGRGERVTWEIEKGGTFVAGNARPRPNRPRVCCNIVISYASSSGYLSHVSSPNLAQLKNLQENAPTSEFNINTKKGEA